MTPNQTPAVDILEVLAWIEGKATAHRRAAITYRRTGRVDDAGNATIVATELSDVAVQLRNALGIAP